MNTTVLKSSIVEAVTLAEKITGKKESLPVLSCILVEVGKEITLRATNLEAGIVISVPAEVQEKGVVAVPASIFSQTLRSIGAEKVTLKAEEGNLLVESRATRTLIKAIPHTEFPKLPDEGETEEITLPREKFLRAMQGVSYAASPSMIRPELGSVFISISRNFLQAVATDSFRLAEKRIVGVTSKQERDVLIPLKHAAELSYILERVHEENIELAADDSQLVVTVGRVRYTSRVVEAQFPNYKEIIPKTFTTEATLLKNDFAEMLRKARVFSGNDQQVGLHIYPKKKIFTATARSSEVGEMSDSLDSALSGEDLDINFHIGYLSECLTSIDSDSITMQFAGIGRPLIIKGVSDQAYTYLVMPLNR